MSMNLRHAAALALVGWYLMTPPPLFHSKVDVDLDAPLSKWTVYSAFDSAQECEAEKVADFHLANQKALGDPTDDPKLRGVRDQLMTAQCIATDDPRLKEK
jgi:hypothetical protein